MHRRAELDWLRGLMLVLMTLTHLPTWFSERAGQPLGFVSAAEGFVFLSAFLVGNVYGRIGREQGYAAMRRVLWRRVGKIYLAQAGLLIVLLWLLLPMAVARGAHPIVDLASFYLHDPHAALLGGLLLVYNPPLLDILPMYVLLMAASPLVIRAGTRRGWSFILGCSVALWVLAQFDAGRPLYEAFARLTGWPVPYQQTGAFSYFAWQLMWMTGLWAGSRALDRTSGEGRPCSPPRMDFIDRMFRSRRPLVAATLVALLFFAWRHAIGQVPDGPPALVEALDKWHLGILRLVDFGALVVLAAYARRPMAQWARYSVLATLGRASLTVFCAHLVICLCALTVVAEVAPAHLRWEDSALLAATLVALYAVAWMHQAGRRWTQPLRLAITERLAARMAR